MRTLIGMLLAATVALPLAGQAGPVVSPKETTMRVGDTAVLAGYQHAGGLSCGSPYHYEFFTDMPSVATVRGFSSGSSTCHPDPSPDNGVVYVIAVAPGVAHVRTGTYPLDLSTITVLPQVLPVEIRTEAARVLSGQQVSMTAIVPGYDQTAIFSWYRGRLGDTTHPIRTSLDPHLTVTLIDAGVSYIWVQALAGSFASSDEIGIEIVQPRRRASR
jgi:hypothetical protein